MSAPYQPFMFYTWFDAHAELPETHRNWADYVNYFQHRIYVGQAFWQSENGRYTNLKCDYLREVIPPANYAKLKTWLVGTRERPKSDFIESDHEWRTATEQQRGKCRGYRVAARYANNPPGRVVCRCRKLSDRIKEARRREYKGFTKTMRAVHANLKKLDLDLADALPLLDVYNFESTEGWDAEQGREATKRLLMIIHDKSDAMPTRCEYSRVHHEVTRLARLFRPCLKVAGTKLVNCDVANSQPLFLYLAVLPFIRSGGICKDDVDADPDAVLTKYPDLLAYKALVEGGQLYGYLIDRVCWTKGKQAFKEECVFRFYYGPNNDINKNGCYDPCPLKPVFQSDFPTVWESIRRFKKANGWRELAREMQRREAAVMIDRVCSRLADRGVWFLPIHDSILTTPDAQDVARSIMAEEMAAAGLNATFGVTDYRTQAEAA